MHNSKLIGILKRCSPEELKRFEKFLNSPYHNTNKNYLKAFRQLRKYAPAFEHKQLEKDTFFSFVFGKSLAYNDKKMMNLMSDLVKLIETFWHMEEFKAQPIDSNLTKARSYFRHNLDYYWELYLDKAEKSIYEDKPEATQLHEHLLLINLDKHHAIEQEEQRNKEPNLQAVHDHLDAYYLVSKLKYYYKLLNFRGFKEFNYDIYLMDTVLEESEREKYQQHFGIQFYYHAVKAILSTDNVENYIQLKQLLKEESHLFAVQEVQDMFIVARNFCAKRINTGDQNYYTEIFDIYKLQIENGLLIANETLSDATVKNVITVALRQNATEWAINFLNRHKRFMEDDVYTFCKSNVRFKQKKYFEVLDLLAETNFKEVLMEMSVKGWELITNFEIFKSNTNDYRQEDLLEEMIRSFDSYLKRNKNELTKRHIYYANLVKYVAELFELVKFQPVDIKKLEKIQQMIQDEKEITQKNWLMETIEEIM